MDKKISVKELLSIIKEYKKTIGIIVIASAVFVGGFRVYSDFREQSKGAENNINSTQNYKEELKEYNKNSQVLTGTIDAINAEKKSAIKLIGENPIMSIDAFSSESVRIKITTTSEASYNAVENVLLTANSSNLFGKENSILERYKWDIVQLPDTDATNESGKSESVSDGVVVGNIYVYSIKGYKAKDVANNVVRFLETERSSRLQGVEFSTVVAKSSEAAKQSLYNRQKMYRANLDNLKLESDKINEAVRSLQIPSADTASNTSYIKRGIKSSILGGIFGAFVAVMFAVYTYLRRQKLDFANLVEREYEIPVLGTSSVDVNVDVLAADLRQLDAKRDGIGFIAINSGRNYLEHIAELIEKMDSNAEYIGCIVDDVNAIDRISDFKNFVLIISNEETDISENVRITINKLSRLEKKILGCINVG